MRRTDGLNRGGRGQNGRDSRLGVANSKEGFGEGPALQSLIQPKLFCDC